MGRSNLITVQYEYNWIASQSFNNFHFALVELFTEIYILISVYVIMNPLTPVNLIEYVRKGCAH